MNKLKAMEVYFRFHSKYYFLTTHNTIFCTSFFKLILVDIGHFLRRYLGFSLSLCLLSDSFRSLLPPASGVRSAGQHLSRWGVVGQVTFVCHCFAPHTSPREKGKELSVLHLPPALMP